MTKRYGQSLWLSTFQHALYCVEWMWIDVVNSSSKNCWNICAMGSKASYILINMTVVQQNYLDGNTWHLTVIIWFTPLTIKHVIISVRCNFNAFLSMNTADSVASEWLWSNHCIAGGWAGASPLDHIPMFAWVYDAIVMSFLLLFTSLSYFFGSWLFFDRGYFFSRVNIFCLFVLGFL